VSRVREKKRETETDRDRGDETRLNRRSQGLQIGFISLSGVDEPLTHQLDRVEVELDRVSKDEERQRRAHLNELTSGVLHRRQLEVELYLRRGEEARSSAMREWQRGGEP
jgi:hypothetical protein